MKNYVIVGIVVILIIGGVVWFKNKANTTEPTDTTTIDQTVATTTDVVGTTTEEVATTTAE